jgi:IS5 family transposase
LEALTRVKTRRIHIDKGYRGHNQPHGFRVCITGQVRRVTRPIRREMKRRAAVDPVIGHLKAEHRLARNNLKGRDGDRINPILAAAGYDCFLLRRWLQRPLRALIQALSPTLPAAANAYEVPLSRSSQATSNRPHI